MLSAAPGLFGQEAPAAEPAEATGVDNADAFVAMGYGMAKQLRLDIGFSEEEMTYIFQGMTQAASGADQPEGFQEDVATALTIYRSRMEAFQQKEQEAARQLAEANKAEAAAFFADLADDEGVEKTESGLLYIIEQPGEGEKPGPSDTVVVNYKGTLLDGTQFDAGEGATFAVNRVVPGFGEGLQLVSPGGKIKLYIPSELAYGDAPQRPGSEIEPGDALIFEVELLEVKAPPAAQMMKRPPNMPPGPPPNMKPPGPPPNMTPPPPPPGPPPDLPPPPPPPTNPPPSGK